MLWLWQVSLKEMVKEHLGVELNKDIRQEFLLGYWRRNDMIVYAAEDALATFRMWPITQDLITKAGLQEVWEIYERPLIPVLADMELNGVKLDLNEIKALEVPYTKELQDAQAALENLAPGLNPNSAPQIRKFFTNILGGEDKLPRVKDKKTGEERVSFDEDALNEINHPVAKAILNVRGVLKLLRTYIISWRTPTTEYIDNKKDDKGHYCLKTGNIHCSFKQMDTATSRLAASDPNLQNIPRDPKFRRPFTCEPWESMAVLDYSQIELRILAELSEDEVMMNTFIKRAQMLEEFENILNENGWDEVPKKKAPKRLLELERQLDIYDFHTQTAIKLFKLDPDTVDTHTPEFKEQRSVSKTINFGIPYGRREAAIAQEIGIPVEEAADHLKQYFKLHIGVDKYLKRMSAESHAVCEIGNKLGLKIPVSMTQSMCGRYRLYPFPNGAVNGGDPKREMANIERAAVNMPIQTSSADITKKALIDLDRELRIKFPKAKIRLTVHDEIVTTAPKEEIKEVAALQKKIMIDAGKFLLKKVPVEVSLHIGDRWEK
jgi:DNA polymerase-1